MQMNCFSPCKAPTTLYYYPFRDIADSVIIPCYENPAAVYVQYVWVRRNQEPLKKFCSIDGFYFSAILSINPNVVFFT